MHILYSKHNGGHVNQPQRPPIHLLAPRPEEAPMLLAANHTVVDEIT